MNGHIQIVESLINNRFVALVGDALKGKITCSDNYCNIPESLPAGHTWMDLDGRTLTMLSVSTRAQLFSSRFDIETEEAPIDLEYIASLRSERARGQFSIADRLCCVCTQAEYVAYVGEGIALNRLLGKASRFVRADGKRRWPDGVFPVGTNPALAFIDCLVDVIAGAFKKPEDSILPFYVGVEHCCDERCDITDDREYVSFRQHPELRQYMWLMAQLRYDMSRYIATDMHERAEWERMKSPQEIALFDYRAQIYKLYIGIVESLLIERALEIKPTIQLPAGVGELVITHDGFVVGRRRERSQHTY